MPNTLFLFSDMQFNAVSPRAPLPAANPDPCPASHLSVATPLPDAWLAAFFCSVFTCIQAVGQGFNTMYQEIQKMYRGSNYEVSFDSLVVIPLVLV